MMIVLGIETSCDETGVALYDSEDGLLADALFSQVEIETATHYAAEDADVTLRADSTTFALLACGRIDPQDPIDDGRVTWSGDDEWGDRAASPIWTPCTPGTAQAM